MNLLDLPSELLQIIFILTIWRRGLRRALRLRTVSKKFKANWEPALYSSGIFEDRQSYPMYRRSNFWLPDCISRVLTYDERIPCVATMIKKIARIISTEKGRNDERSFEATVQSLCKLAIDVSGLYSAALDNVVHDTDLNKHLLPAAAYFNCESLVLKLFDPVLSETESEIFSKATTAAVRGGHGDLAHELLLRMYKSPSGGWYERKFAIKIAVYKGDVNTVKTLMQDDLGPHLKEDKPFRLMIISAVSTAIDPSAFDVALQILKAPGHDSKFAYPQILLDYALNNAARQGFEALVLRLLDMQAPLVCNWHKSNMEEYHALCSAVKGGHYNIVKILLDAGADPNPGFIIIRLNHYGDPLVHAARMESLQMTRLLIEYGAKVNAGDPPPIFYAIKGENVSMYNLLREHGADLEYQNVGRRALKMATEEGMDGMIELLTLAGVRIDGTESVYEYGHPRELDSE